MEKITDLVSSIKEGLTEFKDSTDSANFPDGLRNDVIRSLQHMQDEVTTLQLSIQYSRNKE